MEETLIKYLGAQFTMIDKIMINCDYIFRHNQEQYKKTPNISNSDYLRYLASVISDDIIVNLYKLLKASQDFSFQSFNSKVKHFIEQEGYKFKTREREDFFNKYMTTLEELLNLYQRINWEGIRNKYVGHLDKKRLAIRFELDDLKVIQISLLNIKDYLHKSFYDIEPIEHRSPLIELIEDNIKLKELLE